MRALTLALGLLAGYGATRLALCWRLRTRAPRNPYRAAMRAFLRQERKQERQYMRRHEQRHATLMTERMS